MRQIFASRQFVAIFLVACFAICSSVAAEDASRPNILWLTTEDIGPELNCYGDSTAKTPALDALAAKGLVYDIAWSNYPVCAPARTTIITGMYAGTLGAGNMRSNVRLPSDFKLFPEYMRAAGYYCTNNHKTDYNVVPNGDVWDESSKTAEYRNREPDQPFFAVYNYFGTHESQIRKRPHQSIIDPASVKLKSYWPDVPEVRQDLAQYYNNIQGMDKWLKRKLDQLEKDALAESTIVVFFGDHGSGMPRHKRFAGDSGQHVPFVVHVPEKFKHLAPESYLSGGRTKHPIGFVDLAPTMLSLAGVKPPKYMEGHAFMGSHKTAAPKYLFGYRDRMDERPDFSRSVRDDRFIYVRNFMSHLPAGQFLGYQNETPTTAVWKKMFMEGKLNDVQSQFWNPHPPEEFYDLQNDPEETKNLVGRSEFEEILNRFREVHRKQVIKSNDLGFFSEGELVELANENSTGDLILKNYAISEVLETATMASNGTASLDEFEKRLDSSNPTIRYWAAMGMRIQGAKAAKSKGDLLEEMLSDASPSVAIVAADTLAEFGSESQLEKALVVLERNANFETSNLFHAIDALNAIDRLNEKAKPILDRLKSLPVETGFKRGGGYLKRLVPEILSSQ